LKRRAFITLLGSAAAAWPLKVRAQQGERVPLVGILSNIIEDDAAMKARVGAFRQELEKFGWLPGRNVRIETRFGAVTPQQLQASAKELLVQKTDLDSPSKLRLPFLILAEIADDELETSRLLFFAVRRIRACPIWPS
jgi:hypothetical protein